MSRSRAAPVEFREGVNACASPQASLQLRQSVLEYAAQRTILAKPRRHC
jgi:hypothetical protein